MTTLTGALILTISLSLTTQAAANCLNEDYYASVDPDAGPGKFFQQIHGVISEDVRVRSYKELWELLEYTDAAETKDPQVVLLYTQRDAPNGMAMRDGRARPGAWNREHVWPQSRGVDRGTPPHSDLHHIRPADYLANGSRANKNFEDVIDGDLVFGSLMTVDPLTDLAGEDTRNTFEPMNDLGRRDVKGDVARMLFYMTVRYPYLDLIAGTAAEGSRDPEIGDICTLMEWHLVDPVSDFEDRRNERICEVQGNRNPFIDHPEWAYELTNEICG